jgi:hypothetical protein
MCIGRYEVICLALLTQQYSAAITLSATSTSRYKAPLTVVRYTDTTTPIERHYRGTFISIHTMRSLRSHSRPASHSSPTVRIDKER